MAHKAINVAFRRKREGKTDYKKRLTYLVGKKPRAVIRKTLKHISVQVVEYSPDGDKVSVMVSSKVLAKHGWTYSTTNMPACYLTGLLAGKLALKKGITDAIVDIGMQKSLHGGRLFAMLKGLVDAGVAVPHSKECFPDDKRISGEHIKEYAKKLNEEDYKRQFSAYSKINAKPEEMPEKFKKIKEKILSE